MLDSNVILAGFATPGFCHKVLTICLERHLIFSSEPILAEVREHLAGKFKMPAAAVQEIEQFLREIAEIVVPVKVDSHICRDPDDQMVIGTAVASNADCIITGDKDLLAMRLKFVAIPTPREFYER